MDPFVFLAWAPKALQKRLAQWASPVAGAAVMTELDPLLILGVLDRESNGKKADIVGYDGHGRGLMQFDDRWHRDFCSAKFLGRPMWSTPEFSVLAGALYLDHLRELFSGRTWAAVAAYNRGPDPVAAALRKLDAGASEGELLAAVDAGTTGGNYAADVKRRMADFTAAISAAQRKEQSNG